MPEIVSLVAHTGERYRLAIWVARDAELRASERCGQRMMDIDWQANTLTVNEVQMWVKGGLVIKGPETASGVRTIPRACMADRRHLRCHECSSRVRR